MTGESEPSGRLPEMMNAQWPSHDMIALQRGADDVSKQTPGSHPPGMITSASRLHAAIRPKSCVGDKLRVTEHKALVASGLHGRKPQEEGKVWATVGCCAAL